MSWTESPNGVYAAIAVPVEMKCSKAEVRVGESRSGMLAGERGDSRSPSWESAWIDIGGEG